MSTDVAQASAAIAYQRALEEIHLLTATVSRMDYRLDTPHRRWSAGERRAVERYAAAWTALAAIRAELDGERLIRTE